MKRIESESDNAMARAVLYRVVSTSLLPPWKPGYDALRRPDTATEVRRAANLFNQRENGFAGATPGGPVMILAERWIDATAAASTPELIGEFQRLFGHSLRGLIVPYETEYGPDSAFRQSDELADIGGFYQAFGLTLSQEQGERWDHLAVECEFFSFLARKEVLLRHNGDLAAAERVRDGQRQFFRDHLGCFARAVAEGLTTNAGHTFYKAIGDLLTALVRHDEIALSVPLGAGFMVLRPDVEDNVPMACGSCELLSPRDDE